MIKGGAIFIKYCQSVVGRFLSSLFHSFCYNFGALEVMKCLEMPIVDSGKLFSEA
jgi:hypothetical protein